MKRDDKIKRSQTPLTALLASDQYLSEQAVSELERLPIEKLTQWSHQRRDLAHGTSITYSKKVFIPLTQLCRDVCHYCTFAQPPKKVQQPYLSLDQVLEIARAGEQAGCQEALFTLGEKPELRYPEAREGRKAANSSGVMQPGFRCGSREVSVSTVRAAAAR